MALFVTSDNIRIETTDDVLDRIANLIENTATGSTGFWLAGNLVVERNDETTYPNPAYGSQWLWVPASALITLIYDRPLHPDPDRITDVANVVYI